MSNDNQKKQLADSGLEMKSMRLGFGHGLIEAAKQDPRIVVLCADLVESTGLLPFKEKFPDRFFEVGVAEQNLVTVASGMAAMGKIPFAASYAIFSPGRNWEQIRTTICYNNLPVKLIGTHAGLNVGPDGGSHQALEDIALMRVLPRMTVLSPCDALEAAKCASLMGKTDGPVYIRLPREKSLILTHEKSPFEIGKASIFYESSPKISDLGIIATGPLLYRTLLAAKKLESLGKKVTVMNLSTIKPLDEGAIINLAKKTKAIVTIEEHQRFGGMGSAVAECLVTHHPVPIEFVAVNDRFGQSGQAEELLDLYGFRVEDIVEAGKRVVLRKER